jgi:hypothetical protein
MTLVSSPKHPGCFFGPPGLPIQWVPGVISLEGEQLGCDAGPDTASKKKYVVPARYPTMVIQPRV